MGQCATAPTDKDETNQSKQKICTNAITDSQRNAPSMKPMHSNSSIPELQRLKQSEDTDKDDKYDKRVYDTILSSPGQLEIPQNFQKWFPSQHAHKDVTKLFNFHREIGHGVTGSVHEITYQSQICALKQMEKNDHWSRMLFQTEARVLSKLKHPNIIKYIDMFFDDDYYYLLLEKADYDLFSVMNKKGRLSERKTRNITYSLLKALRYIHKKDVAHRDLKPENIVFISTDTNNPRLIDFGDAERARKDRTYTEFVGTPPYMSPERLEEHKGWQLKKADIWALAVIAYEMYCGQRCFGGDTQKQVFGRILRGEWSWPNDRIPSQEMQDFVEQCLSHDASLRPSAKEALQHSWFDVKRKEEEEELEKQSTMRQRAKLKLVDNTSNVSTVSLMSLDEQESKTEYGRIKKANFDGVVKLKDVTEIDVFDNLASMVQSNALQDILIKGYAQKLDDDDLAPYEQQFDQLDTDKDGFITGMDLINAFTANGIGPNQASSLASIIISQLDPQRTNKVNFRQFLEARLKYDLSNRPREIFDDIINASQPALNNLTSNTLSVPNLYHIPSNVSTQNKESEASKQINSGFESEYSRSNASFVFLGDYDDERDMNMNHDDEKAISSQDIIAFSKSCTDLNISREKVQEIFVKYDKNGDGKLRFPDFVQAVYAQRIVDHPVHDQKNVLSPPIEENAEINMGPLSLSREESY